MSYSLSNQQNVSGPVAGKLAATNPNMQAGSIMHAEAVAPATATTGEQIAQGTAMGPPCGVPETEKAYGQAAVDTSFLSSMQPNMSGMQSALQRVSDLEAHKASQQAAAQAALQQAGLLMAQAAQQEQEALRAAETARQELMRTQMAVSSQTEQYKQEREALAAKDKIGAEMEARAAAKAKAEETAALEAARLAAAEAAEADAMAKAATAKREQAMRSMKELEAKMRDAKLESVAATQRAADLTAKSEAHHREAQLADQQMGQAAATLQRMDKELLSSTSEVKGDRSNVAAAFVPAPTISSSTIGTTSAPSARVAPVAPVAHHSSGMTTASSIKEKECCAHEGVESWQPMTTFVRGAPPKETEFVNLLHIRIPRAELGNQSAGAAGGSVGKLPDRVLLRFRSGTIESCTDRALDARAGGMWNVEGNLPIRNPSDLVQISVLDATGFTDWHTFDWDRARVIGQLHLKISNLVDGHISNDNHLRLDGIGGTLFALLHMEKWPSKSSSSVGSTGATAVQPSHGNYSGWGWNQFGTGADASRSYWTLARQSTTSQSLGTTPAVPQRGGMMSSGVPTGTSGGVRRV